MPSLFETLGAIGPAIPAAGREFREYSKMLSTEQAQKEQLALSRETLEIAKRRETREEDQAKDQMRIEKAKEARVQAEYERGNMLVNPKDYLIKFGAGPRTTAAYLEAAGRKGFIEKTPDGDEGVRQRNLAPGLKAIHDDLNDMATILEADLQDTTETLNALQEKALKSPTPELEAQIDKLIVKKSNIYTSWDYIEQERKKHATMATTEAARIRLEPVTPERQRQTLEVIEAKGTEAGKVAEIKTAGMAKVARINAEAKIGAARIRASVAEKIATGKASKAERVWGLLAEGIEADGLENLSPVKQQALEVLTGVQAKDLTRISNLMGKNLNIMGASSPEEYRTGFNALMRGIPELAPFALATPNPKKARIFDPANAAHIAQFRAIVGRLQAAGVPKEAVKEKALAEFSTGAQK